MDMVRLILLSAFDLYAMIIIIYVLMSWLPNRQGLVGDIYNALGRLCDPYLDLFKRIIPPIGGMVDISPIIALIVLQVVARLVAAFL